MPRRFLHSLVIVGLAVTGVAGCDNGSSTPVTPPATTPITEPPFTGALTPNGSILTQFTTSAAGTVTATVADLTPEPAAPTGIALDLGTWNGISCALQIETPNVDVGSSVTGQAAGAGTLCIRISDAAGTLTGPVNFTVNIVHE